ncbi:MAG: hypothetical protein GXX96_21825 [Planctomycetaceae bacterium]|nr:hypothetical protein [Planctomycetaceae bacterium]
MAMRSGRSNNLARSGEMTAAIRSGRFQLTIPAAQEAPITHGVTGLSYRIFNTGKTEFSVQASGVAAVPLKTGMSVDLKVQAGGVINIANPSAKEITVRGIYEQLGDPWNPVRGGRFISDTNDDIDIIRERAGAYCRIFNSSKNTVFKVVLSNRNQVQVVPRCSGEHSGFVGGNWPGKKPSSRR